MENVGEDVLRYAESRGINLKKAGQYVTCYYYDCQKNKTYSDNFFYKKTIAIKQWKFEQCHVYELTEFTFIHLPADDI